jgi:hypothetical protein
MFEVIRVLSKMGRVSFIGPPLFIGAKSIPFHKKYETIDKELSHYFGLISLLNLKYHDRKSRDDNYYVIGDEPGDKNSKEHKIWENIRNNPAVTLIDSPQSRYSC